MFSSGGGGHRSAGGLPDSQRGGRLRVLLSRISAQGTLANLAALSFLNESRPDLILR